MPSPWPEFEHQNSRWNCEPSLAQLSSSRHKYTTAHVQEQPTHNSLFLSKIKINIALKFIFVWSESVLIINACTWPQLLSDEIKIYEPLKMGFKNMLFTWSFMLIINKMIQRYRRQAKSSRSSLLLSFQLYKYGASFDLKWFHSPSKFFGGLAKS